MEEKIAFEEKESTSNIKYWKSYPFCFYLEGKHDKIM